MLEFLDGQGWLRAALRGIGTGGARIGSGACDLNFVSDVVAQFRSIPV